MPKKRIHSVLMYKLFVDKISDQLIPTPNIQSSNLINL